MRLKSFYNFKILLELLLKNVCDLGVLHLLRKWIRYRSVLHETPKVLGVFVPNP